MKTASLISAGAILVVAFTATVSAGPEKKPEVRVGVYDSRAVAYAYFWSAPRREERDALIARAKDAKRSGDTALLNQLKPQIAAAQRQSMLEVFSTAPADEAMASLKDRLPPLRRELGLDRLVSKWDTRALRGVSEADRVDVTDRLVREFLQEPTEKQLKMLESMEAAKPIPLWQVKLIALFGGG